MFEYKVKCRHKLGWKEIKLYADTDIEEFFNRNSIDYVRNMTDTVEHRQLKEINRLNNIINELEKDINENIKVNDGLIICGLSSNSERKECKVENEAYYNILNKLKELKEDNKNV